MRRRLHISIVVPTLNESAWIGRALESCREQEGPLSIFVADGGSVDDTVKRAAALLPDAALTSSEPGRAKQMNAGAARGEGEVLLFLHADTTLPPGALATVRDALADPHVVGGCFRTAFSTDLGGVRPFGGVGRAAMRLWEARIWMRWHRLAFGDRALFVRRDVFETFGGFPDQPLFEDLALVRRIRARGRFVFLEDSVETSARRFEEHGAVRQQVRNAALWLGWIAGVAPERLKRFYPDAPCEHSRSGA